MTSTQTYFFISNGTNPYYLSSLLIAIVIQQTPLILMSYTNAELQSRNEDRLRFQIEQETSEWKELRQVLAKRRQNHEKQCFAVCISRLNRSKLPHYLTDPIKDADYPIEILPKATKIAEIILLIRRRAELGKFKSLVMFDSRGRMLTPEARLSDLQPQYNGQILFLKYTDSNYFG